MFEGSAKLRGEFFERHSQLLAQLARDGQHPQALFVGCSDSRLTPEALLGAVPGDLFMIRNVANIVPPYIQTDMGITSALEYGVIHLRIPHLIVCGHTDCGGIRGLDTHLDLSREPSLSRWLELARPARRDVDLTLRGLTAEERHVAIVERNVVQQLANAQSYPFVRTALEQDRLELHGWVFYLERQELRRYDPSADQFVAF